MVPGYNFWAAARALGVSKREGGLSGAMVLRNEALIVGVELTFEWRHASLAASIYATVEN